MRRLISICLVIMLTLPLQAAVCCGLDRPCDGTYTADGAFSDFFIIRFKDGYDCGAAVSVGIKYLAQQTYRADADQLEKLKMLCGDGILYTEPDAVRTLCETDGDSGAVKQPGKLSPADASGITVAVLDTGIDRQHPGFKNVKIKNGYNCPENKPYVTGDKNGHGTKVAGIIASYAENVTILPIRVATSQNMIYSSDLIYALRYAADNGADIINMSFGGYTYSYAEQDAINYALEKGCILVAASGNDGLTSLGGNESYPASYEGVISVGSVSADGKLSLFSQASSNVDISACGEKVSVFENKSYSTDSGTSFSCAAVSALAAACKKAADGARFRSAEMYAVINSACGYVRAEGIGFGTADTASMLGLSRLPIITGVREGAVYGLGIRLSFNGGSALLDGEEAFDGDAVMTAGQHTLTVTNPGGSTTVKFIISGTELEYTYNEYDDRAEFVFENGSGFLDGLPYVSGTAITQSGDHIFLLKDEYGRTAGETVCPVFGIDLINGVSDGGTYHTPVHITVNKPSTLNGTEFVGEIWLYESGDYTLTTGGKTLSFVLELDDVQRITIDAAERIAVSQEYSVAAAYTIGGGGFDIYSLESGKKLKFISAAEIFSCHSDSEKLYVICKNNIYVYSFASLLSDSPSPDVHFRGEFSPAASALEEDVLYFISGDVLYSFDGEDMLQLIETQKNSDCISIYDGTVMTCCVSLDGSSVMLYDIGDGTAQTLRLGANLIGKDMLLTKQNIICGKKIFTLDGTAVGTVGQDGPLLLLDGAVIAREGAYTDGNEYVYRQPLKDAAATQDMLYLFDGETLTCLPRTAVGFGGAPDNEPLFESNPLSENGSLLLTSDREYLGLTAGEGKLYMIIDGIQKLFVLDADDMRLISSHPLRFQPDTVQYSEGKVLLTFKNTAVFSVYEGGEISYIGINFIPGRMFACGEYIFTTVGSRIMCIGLDGTPVDADLPSTSAVAVHDGRLYSARLRRLTCIDPADMSVVYETELEANADGIVVGDGYALAGNTLIKLSDGTALGSYVENVHCFIGGYAVTDAGVIRTGDKRYYNTTACEYAITDGRYVFIKGIAGLIRVDASPLEDVQTSIDDGALYNVSATVSFNVGAGYLNGERIESGHTLSAGGVHTFMLCLPLGITEEYTFSIAPELEGIKINSHTRMISTGDTLMLHVTFLPDGASSVPLVFSPDSDIVTVSDSGIITALAGGTVNITVSTADGRFSDVYTLKISDKALKFKPDSIPRIDRENMVIYDIPAGTYAFQLKGMSAVDGDIYIYDTDGSIANGIIHTGMTLVHRIDDTEDEQYVLAVCGDLDGDGFITSADLDIMTGLLSSPGSGTALQRTAADLNLSGTLTGYDMAMLKSQLLYQRMFCPFPPLPQEKLNGCVIYSSAHADADGYIYLSLSSRQAVGLSGINGKINVSGAKFDKVVFACGDCETHEGNGFVSFLIRDAECSGGIMLLRFRSEGSAADFKVTNVTAVVGDTVFTTPDLGCSTAPYNQSNKLSITIANALKSLKLEKDVYEYTAFVPRDAMFADVAVSRPAVISGGILSDDGGTVTVTLIGTKEIYTIHIVKTDHTPDSENRLKSLGTAEYALSPAFSPDITEYTVLLPHGAKLPEISFQTMSSAATAVSTVFASCVTVTVRAETGEELVYTIDFIYENDHSSEDISSSAPPASGKTGLWLITLVPAVIFAALLPAVISKRRSKK